MKSKTRLFVFLWLIGAVDSPDEIASAQVISELVVFGDSESDTGNTADVFNIPDSPPYFAGRFSNGPMWVEVLAERLEVSNPRPSELAGSNYAYGGATTGASLGFDNPQLLNTNAQVAAYLRDHTPTGSELFILNAGYNDFFFEPVTTLEIANELSRQITDLASSGAKHLLVPNVSAGVPDFDREKLLSAPELNSLMDERIDQIVRDWPIRIYRFDARRVTDGMFENPSEFEFTQVQQPACLRCSDTDREAPVQISEDPDEHLIWDDTHYSSVAHAVIGSAAFDALPSSLKPNTIRLIENADWRFIRGISEPSEEALAWTQNEFDTSQWESGGLGVGFGDSEDLHFVDTLLEDMRRNYSSVYLRTQFQMEEPHQFEKLLLHIDYDDALVAYINGVEVARSVFGESNTLVPHDARLSIPDRDSSYREVFEIDLAEFQDLLKQENVLGIQGINRRVGDRDFVVAQLSLSGVVAVPEPATPGVLVLAISCLRRRRRNFKATRRSS